MAVPKNILIYRTGRLGDFLVALPAINVIRRAFPGAWVTLLTTLSSQVRFATKSRNYVNPDKPLPWLEFVMPSTVDEVLQFESLRDWKHLRTLRHKIRQRRYAEAFILPFAKEPFQNRFKKWLFLRALGVHGPIHGLRADDGRLFSQLSHMHQIEAPLRAARQSLDVAKLTNAPVTFDLCIPQFADDWAAQQWQQRGWGGKRVVAVFAGGSYEHKRWSPENFAAVCARLAGDPLIAFVLIGSAAERVLANLTAAALPGDRWNACGETDLPQLAALLKRCQLFLGNDSGPGHLAAALGVPCVALMSSVHEAGLWEPWGRATTALRHTVPCSPCRCETHCPIHTEACVRNITVAEALRACQEALGAVNGNATLKAHPI